MHDEEVSADNFKDPDCEPGIGIDGTLDRHCHCHDESRDSPHDFAVVGVVHQRAHEGHREARGNIDNETGHSEHTGGLHPVHSRRPCRLGLGHRQANHGAAHETTALVDGPASRVVHSVSRGLLDIFARLDVLGAKGKLQPAGQPLGWAEAAGGGFCGHFADGEPAR